MTKQNLSSPYSHLLHIILQFSQMATIGIFITFFLTTYLTFDNSFFAARLRIYSDSLLYLWLISLLASLMALNFRKREIQNAVDIENDIPQFYFNREDLLYHVFMILLTIILILKYLAVNFQILNFLTFLAATLAILNIARYYSINSKRETWNHPTTAGSIVEGTILLGASMGLWSYTGGDLQNVFGWIILITLLFEMLTIWSRFRFLSRHSTITQFSLQMMLGSHLALFGVRFIFGIIMPFVYLIWVLFVSDIPLHPVILMIFVGELSERILFFITASEEIITESQPLEKENSL